VKSTIIDFVAEKKKREGTRRITAHPTHSPDELNATVRAVVQSRVTANNSTVELSQVLGAIGYISTEAGVTEPHEAMDMLCDILFGCTHQQLLTFYKEQVSK
jgi:hypothetical protein